LGSYTKKHSSNFDAREAQQNSKDGIARTWSGTRREWEATSFEDVASKIESGDLTIKGADPEAVKARLQSKADRIRDGENVYRGRGFMASGVLEGDEANGKE
jgi:hypothetical protein